MYALTHTHTSLRCPLTLCYISLSLYIYIYIYIFLGISQRFEAHAGPVLSVDASPFHRNLFATAGADGVLKISSTLQARPVLCLDPNAGHVDGGLGGVLHNVSWSRTRPLVIGVCSSLGQYSIFDLGKSTSLPVVKLVKDTPLHCSSFNHKMRSFLALGWADGSVSIYCIYLIFV
jgi:WD repeat-containing protein 34